MSVVGLEVKRDYAGKDKVTREMSTIVAQIGNTQVPSSYTLWLLYITASRRVTFHRLHVQLTSPDGAFNMRTALK